MEVSLFSLPEANANLPAAAGTAAVCPRQEFSLLMAAFLKSAQPEALIEAGVLETGVGQTVEASVLTVQQPAVEDGAKSDDAAIPMTGDVVEESPAQVTEALAGIFIPVVIERMPMEGAPAPEVKIEIKAEPKGNGSVMAALNAPFERVDGNGQLPTDENGKAIMEEGRVDLQQGFDITPQRQKEHFEIEIPVEEIIGERVEQKVEIPLVASSTQTIEGLRSAVSEAPAPVEHLASIESEKTGSENEDTGAVEKGSADGAQKAEAAPIAREFDFSGDKDENAEENNTAQIEAVKTPENHLSGAVFESAMDKAVDQIAPKADAPAQRPAVAAEVHEKVQAGVRISVESNGGEVKMKLHPESLGEVRIKLNVESGLVRAEIVVDNPEVKSIIEADSSFLRDSLGQHGLTLDKCVVEVGRSFEASGRESDEKSQMHSEERGPQSDERDSDRGKGAWQRHFRNQARQDEGGIDFFA